MRHAYQCMNRQQRFFVAMVLITAPVEETSDFLCYVGDRECVHVPTDTIAKRPGTHAYYIPSIVAYVSDGDVRNNPTPRLASFMLVVNVKAL